MDTAEGLSQREAYCITLVADATRIYGLAQDEATRNQDANLAAVAYLKLGWTYYLQVKYAQAVEMMDKGIAFNPDYATLYFVKGLAQLALNDEANARRSYAAGLEAANKLKSADRAPLLDDAISDLGNLGRQKPALKAITDELATSLEAAK